MSVPLSAAVTLGLLFFLSVGLNEQVAEGCTCVQRHPQRVFCESDIVIRAKILGSVASTRPNLLAYSIKVITTFKPFNKMDIQVIYSTKICGARPQNGEYLLSGHLVDGVMVFGLCELVWRWDQLSTVQKRNLNLYQTGCACEDVPDAIVVVLSTSDLNLLGREEPNHAELRVKQASSIQIFLKRVAFAYVAL
ncbi:metalloproteinase inhibitor 3-like isoform X2 [Carassius auratus]|uniref:Metalloproteinase inhibitor 4 n=1 Tax=Carassius auratus TaxID=7957 RepID=A0A6P6KW70_CARAU|nr:metalloproteinase inhibitor 3-like isoform X2 [Carassius auratus]